MQKLFKNACVVDIESGKTKNVDILVENGKIKKFENKIENFDGVVEDLNGDFVMPNFVNVFCHSLHAFEKNYASLEGKNNAFQKNVKDLMLVKNVLAGVTPDDLNQIDAKTYNSFLLTDVENLEEKELSALSDLVAKSKYKLFIKAGQTLEELGTIDKIYHKSLAEVLEDFGFLDRKPIIVGGNCFEKDELQLFSQYDCDFCLTVGEDGKFGKRPTNLISLNSLDFCVGLGSGYNFEIDFFAFMRQILMTQRGLFEDENCVTEQDVLKMATYNGSKILTGTENKLQEGGLANFVVVKKTPSLYDDVFKTLVWEKSKKDVVLTVQNGEILQKNGKIFMKNVQDYDTIIKTIKQI